MEVNKMTRAEKSKYLEFYDLCKERNPAIEHAQVEQLCRLAKDYSKIGYSISINPYIDYDKIEVKKDKIKEAVDEIIKKYLPGVTINSYNLDPRGYAIKFDFPNGRTNSFGGKGWGVPEIGFKKEQGQSL